MAAKIIRLSMRHQLWRTSSRGMYTVRSGLQFRPKHVVKRRFLPTWSRIIR